MNYLHNVLFNPYLTGHSFVQPAYSMITMMHSSWQKATLCLGEIPFVLKYRNIAPRSIGESKEMSSKDLFQLRIRCSDFCSDRFFLRGKRFSVQLTEAGYLVTLISGFSPQKDDRVCEEKSGQEEIPCHFENPPTCDGWTFTKETLKRTAILAGASVCAVVSMPILLSLFVVGCSIKSRYSSQYFKRPVQVRKIDPLEYSTVAKITREWQLVVDERGRFTPEANIFGDCRNISKLVSQCLEKPKECEEIFDEAFVCEDEKKRIQGVALIYRCDFSSYSDSSGKYVKLAHMVTHPHNIRSSVNRDDYERVEGSGSALIKAIAKQTDVGVYLESVDSAIPFYQKLGFKEISRKGLCMIESCCTPMILTAEKIKRFVSNISK